MRRHGRTGESAQSEADFSLPPRSECDVARHVIPPLHLRAQKRRFSARNSLSPAKRDASPVPGDQSPTAGGTTSVASGNALGFQGNRSTEWTDRLLDSGGMVQDERATRLRVGRPAGCASQTPPDRPAVDPYRPPSCGFGFALSSENALAASLCPPHLWAHETAQDA